MEIKDIFISKEKKERDKNFSDICRQFLSEKAEIEKEQKKNKRHKNP
ncbi:MAG: hypothetical protein LKJ13_00825 [Clostridia bacterium]|jgi:hypothetical protein|nr:hypothetical protein [Clostridia bacterium]MCI1999387.1 hypothetical protein [Clostridia bacterium]MCI2015111.1 hypothetical protein [Clostridia bacterium]